MFNAQSTATELRAAAVEYNECHLHSINTNNYDLRKKADKQALADLLNAWEAQQELEASLEAQVEDLEPTDKDISNYLAAQGNIQLPACDFEGQPVYDTSAQDTIDYANDCANGICPVVELPVLPEDINELKELLTSPMQYDQGFQPTDHGQPMVWMLTALVVISHAIYTLMEPLVTPLVTKYTPSTRRVARRASRFHKEMKEWDRKWLKPFLDKHLNAL